ncbi:MAG: hypothetical protein JWL59_246 [Chthoniobacteraceae bacterium]|nr:hypothetical protein [Chthoniobacteraceae bacterium]
MRRLVKFLFLLLGLFIVFRFWPASELRHAPGILVAGDPNQTAITPASLGEVDGFQLTAVALYEITARVLHTKHYRGGAASRLVPFDVAVGWGPMSDQAVLDQLDISQSNRFFFYSWEGAPPIDKTVLAGHSANMHLIASNRSVANGIGALKSGEVVAIIGYLVNAAGPEGFYWNTSLSRTDTGNGACELLYVTAIRPAEQ